LQQGRQLAEQVEIQVQTAIHHSNIVTHIEPREDAVSLEDATLDR
jgi:hypothetical protein